MIELLADHVVCKGDFISPQGAILLRLFGRELAAFKMDLLCGWVRVASAFESVVRPFHLSRKGFSRSITTANG